MNPIHYPMPKSYKIFNIVLIFTITGCADLGTNPGDVSENPESVSYSGDIQLLFNERCDHCHPNSGSLDLTMGNSYDNLVNVVSTGYVPALRIVPGDPENSVLWNKINGTGVFGQRMPADGTLSVQEILLIETWIREGAGDN